LARSGPAGAARRGIGAGAREGTEPLTQWGGRGDQDRGQRGAGGLARLDGVIPVDHQQPQRFAVTVGAHLRRAGAGQQFPRRPHRVDRIALARPALAHVPGAVNLADLLACAGQVPGQAQAVVTGALYSPRQPPARGRGTGPGQGGQAGAGSTRDTSLKRHATRRSGTARVT